MMVYYSWVALYVHFTGYKSIFIDSRSPEVDDSVQEINI